MSGSRQPTQAATTEGPTVGDTMSGSTQDLVVRRSVTVAAPVERAWAVYTEGYGSWYPKDHYIGAEPAETVLIEPFAGGRWFEKQADGSEPEWGRVLVWDPPHRLVLSWMVGGDWQHDPDPAHASEVEVRFVAESPDRTRWSWSTAASSGTAPARRRSSAGCQTRPRATRSTCAASPPRWRADRAGRGRGADRGGTAITEAVSALGRRCGVTEGYGI